MKDNIDAAIYLAAWLIIGIIIVIGCASQTTL